MPILVVPLQDFVGIDFGQIGRKIENIDGVEARIAPLVKLFRMVQAQTVNNHKPVERGIMHEGAEKLDEALGVDRTVV